jgi:hypothetical protein
MTFRFWGPEIHMAALIQIFQDKLLLVIIRHYFKVALPL